MRLVLSILAALSLVVCGTSAAWPRPTPQQLAYGGEISALIHFDMSTFFHDGDPGCTDRNWNACEAGGGCSSSQVSSFRPTNLNVSAWIQSMKDLGATSAVLTAKHGCGFLLWETKTSLPTGEPYRYHVPPALPVLEQFVDQCRAAGIGYGFYYSLTNNFYLNVAGHYVRPASTLLPGQAAVTQQQYEDLAIAQMRELWTQYGDLTEIWLDGGPGPIGPRVAALLNETRARNAVAFNGGNGVSANAVRWCGTEGGDPQGYPTVWSTACCGWCPDGSGSGCAPNASGATWYPSGVDFTLQLGDHWFYTPGDGIHSLSDLKTVYHKSVGANGHLEIDFAIDRTGGIDPAHAQRYREFGDWIRACYGKPLGTAQLAGGVMSATVTFTGQQTFDRVMLTEDLTQGHTVASYQVSFQSSPGSSWTIFSSGQPIGSKRIDLGRTVRATSVRVTVLSVFLSLTPNVTIAVFQPCA
eukprot:m.227635 g.227635  ORF g.227635 m.227635 type:complete len:468 (+) comp17272_c0_seq1:38-1441(+)